MISNRIVQAMGKYLRDKGYQPYKRRPSLAGPERCIRQMVYYAMGAPISNPTGDRLAMTMEISKMHEEAMKFFISKTPGLTLSATQEKIEVEGLSGDQDGRLDVDWRPDVEKCHYELKAPNRYSFDDYLKQRRRPMDYFTQSAFYNKGTQAKFPGVNKTCLTMICKDTARLIDFLFQYNIEDDTLDILELEASGIGEVPLTGETHFTNVIQGAIEKFDMVDQYVAHNELPDRPHEIGCTFPCGYCTWEDTCWEEHEEEIRALGQLGEIPIEHEEHYKYHLEAAMHKKNAEEEYEALKPESVRLLLSTGCRVAKCGKYTVSYQSRKKDGKTTSEWVRVTLKEGQNG